MLRVKLRVIYRPEALWHQPRLGPAISAQLALSGSLSLSALAAPRPRLQRRPQEAAASAGRPSIALTRGIVGTRSVTSGASVEGLRLVSAASDLDCDLVLAY
jgi:hypothetical protein